MKGKLYYGFLFAAVILSLVGNGIPASLVLAPHDEVNSISCASCHADPLPETGRSAVCETCHGMERGAPLALTHANTVIHGNQPAPYEGLTFTCLDCHDPHFHYQLMNLPDVFLITGSINPGSIIDNGNNTSSFDYSSAIIKEGWRLPPHADNADWGAKSAAGRGLILVADKDNPDETFEIISADNSRITVNGTMNPALAGNAFGIIYGQHIKNTVIPDANGNAGPVPVRFFDQEGQNSFADGDTNHDGICEVCHTRTKHFRNDGTAPEIPEVPGDGIMEHTAGVNCTICHTHASGFGLGGGADCESCHEDWGAHPIHVQEQYGLKLACFECHDTNNYFYFISGVGSAPYDFTETDVCDSCHSPEGSYNGVISVGDSVGAKDNWNSGVYDAGFNLQTGKEKWCVGCHDDVPAVIRGVSAPNVAGDDVDYGFYLTGHGSSDNGAVACLECHDATATHIDGTARTYTAAADNYQIGYRLKSVDGQEPLMIPRTGGTTANQFRLCFSCHDSAPFLAVDNAETNFRKDVNDDCSPADPNNVNKHWYHLQSAGVFKNSWDSDWDGSQGDSWPSCPACHNVHGAKTRPGVVKAPAMIRTGELIGRTSALNLNYFINPCNGQTLSTTNELAGSTGGVFSGGGGRTIEENGVCTMCHNVYSPYWRTAQGVAVQGDPGSVNVFYIDASAGNDANDGLTEQSAWKTLAKANAVGFAAGEKVLFKRGERWREHLRIPSSGTVDKPIVFGAYGDGDPPIIDATSPTNGWTALGNNLYSLLWVVQNVSLLRPSVLVYGGEPMPPVYTLTFADLTVAPAPHNILLQAPWQTMIVTSADINDNTVSGTSVFDGWSTTNPVSALLGSIATNPPGAPPIDVTPKLVSLTEPGHWYWHDNTLYLYSEIPPDDMEVEVVSQVYAIDSNQQDYITIQDLAVRSGNSASLILQGTDHATLRNLIIRDTGMLYWGSGITVWNSSYNTISNNEVKSTLKNAILCTAWNGVSTRGNKIAGNYIHHTGGTGVVLDNQGASNNIIEHNSIGYANQLSYDSAGIHLGWSGTGNVIRFNEIFNGGTNYLKSAGIMADNNPGPTRISYNIIYGNTNGGIDLTGSGHEIYNNTLYKNNEAAWNVGEITFFPVGVGVSDCRVKNNIMVASDSKFLFKVNNWGTDSTLDHDIDYNVYIANAENPFLWGDNGVSDFGTWKQQSSQDAHSFTATNVLRDPVADFELTDNAPAIDAGIDVGLRLDFAGKSVPHNNKVDMGALEHY